MQTMYVYTGPVPCDALLKFERSWLSIKQQQQQQQEGMEEEEEKAILAEVGISGARTAAPTAGVCRRLTNAADVDPRYTTHDTSNSSFVSEEVDNLIARNSAAARRERVSLLQWRPDADKDAAEKKLFEEGVYKSTGKEPPVEDEGNGTSDDISIAAEKIGKLREGHILDAKEREDQEVGKTAAGTVQEEPIRQRTLDSRSQVSAGSPIRKLTFGRRTLSESGVDMSSSSSSWAEPGTLLEDLSNASNASNVACQAGASWAKGLTAREVLTGHDFYVWNVAYLPDKGMVASASEDDTRYG